LTAAAFGDFLGAGRLHLEAATGAGDRQAACLPDVVPPLYRLVTVMSRYFEDLAPRDEIEGADQTDLEVWERAILDAGAAVRVAAGCLYRAAADLGPGGPVSRPASSRARHLAGAATGLAVGRDLLHTHIATDPAGLARERSDWAPAVTSLPVTRALAAEIAAWSARLAPLAARLAGLAPPHISRRPADQLFLSSPREELASAGRWLRAASAALRPALDEDPVRAQDAELLHAIPAAFPPPRQPLGPAAESVAGLCDGITLSASRLRAAIHRSPDSWPAEVTPGGWQWTAQAAAVTSHLGEMALRSLAIRAAQLPGLGMTGARLESTAGSLSGMRTAWQQVGLKWDTFITERRAPPTLAMSEASDLLLRMGRLVWDNPRWTPARAGCGPRRDPAAVAPGTAAFAAAVSAAHQAADALAQVAITDTAAVQAAARTGQLYVPTRSLPARYDVPRPVAPALNRTVRELRDAYHDAAETSAQAARELGELAIAVGGPSKALALARAAALVPSRRRDRQHPWPDDRSRHDPPGAGASFRDSRASTGQPGPVERAVMQHRVPDPVILLRAAAIDNAARDLISPAGHADTSPEPGTQGTRTAVLLAAQGFPNDPVAGQPPRPSPPGRRPGGPSPGQTRLRKN
jgi:hypothetical protein